MGAFAHATSSGDAKDPRAAETAASAVPELRGSRRSACPHHNKTVRIVSTRAQYNFCEPRHLRAAAPRHRFLRLTSRRALLARMQSMSKVTPVSRPGLAIE
ncbi:hypothetical protein GCM10023083_25390 [Streptomyces phyllanthi]